MTIVIVEINVNQIKEFVTQNLYFRFFYFFPQDDQVSIQIIEIVLIAESFN